MSYRAGSRAGAFYDLITSQVDVLGQGGRDERNNVNRVEEKKEDGEEEKKKGTVQ